MSASGLSGGIALAIDSFRPSLVARSTGHQAALFGLSAALGYGAGTALRKALDLAGVHDPIMSNRWARAGAFAGVLGVSAPIIVRRSEQERAAHADWGQPAMRPGVAAAQGVAVAAGLVGTTLLARNGIGAAARSASDRYGGPPAVWASGTLIAAAGAVAAVVPPARDALFHSLAKAGTTPDQAFVEPPEHPGVSGGPGSLVPYDTHAREGSRFVHLASTAERITAITGEPARDPIRVFVGVAAGATPEERVALAVAELERLGAFQRRAILAVSPAGTGYANPVPVEALELMTGGDCASVAVQYGVLPSMFSGPAIPDAARTYRLLIDALQGRGPTVFSYGESLGAQAAQIGLRDEPSRFGQDGAFDGIDAALYVGTPAGTGIRRSAEHRSAVFVVDRWQDLPDPLPPQYRVFLLDHDADPVTRFETPLLWTRPDWLAAQPRGRGVPEQMAWRPLLTWLQVMFDVARATQPQLGQFQSHGHDYRADLAPLVRAAFVSDVDVEILDAVQEELERSEVRRSELLAQ
jgi:uncharacterized membrane protein